MDLLHTGPVSYSSAFSTFGEKREGGREKWRERRTGRKGEGDRLGGKGEVRERE